MIVVNVRDVESCTKSVRRIFTSIAVAPSQSAYTVVGAQEAGNNDLVPRYIVGGKGVDKVFPYIHEQPFGLGCEVWCRVREFFHFVIFTTIYTRQAPKAHTVCFGKRLQRLYAVAHGCSEVDVVQIIEGTSISCCQFFATAYIWCSTRLGIESIIEAVDIVYKVYVGTNFS